MAARALLYLLIAVCVIAVCLLAYGVIAYYFGKSFLSDTKDVTLLAPSKNFPGDGCWSECTSSVDDRFHSVTSKKDQWCRTAEQDDVKDTEAVGDQFAASPAIENGATTYVYMPHFDEYACFDFCAQIFSKDADCAFVKNPINSYYLRRKKVENMCQFQCAFQIEILDKSDKDLLMWGDKIRLVETKDMDGTRRYVTRSDTDTDDLLYSAIRRTETASADSEWYVVPWCNTAAVQRDPTFVHWGDDMALLCASDKSKGYVQWMSSRSNPDTHGWIFSADPSKGDKSRYNSKATRLRFYAAQPGPGGKPRIPLTREGVDPDFSGACERDPDSQQCTTATRNARIIYGLDLLIGGVLIVALIVLMGFRR